MTVAERIKRTTKKDSMDRYLSCKYESVIFKHTFYCNLAVIEAVFIDGSKLTMRHYYI